MSEMKCSLSQSKVVSPKSSSFTSAAWHQFKWVVKRIIVSQLYLASVGFGCTLNKQVDGAIPHDIFRYEYREVECLSKRTISKKKKINVKF